MSRKRADLEKALCRGLLLLTTLCWISRPIQQIFAVETGVCSVAESIALVVDRSLTMWRYCSAGTVPQQCMLFKRRTLKKGPLALSIHLCRKALSSTQAISGPEKGQRRSRQTLRECGGASRTALHNCLLEPRSIRLYHVQWRLTFCDCCVHSPRSCCTGRTIRSMTCAKERIPIGESVR